MKIRQIALAFGLCLFGSYSNAEVNGSFLLAGLEADQQIERENGKVENKLYFKAIMAIGFMAGVRQQAEAVGIYCFPDGNEDLSDQLQRMALKYLQEHPEELHLRGEGLLLRAWSQFICRDK